MKHFFMLSTVFTVLSAIVLVMQTFGTMEFYVTLAALGCCLLVSVFSGIMIKKGK